jgi:hypothetical protein
MDTHLVVVSMVQADGERFLLVDADLRTDFVDRFAKAWVTESAEERARVFQEGWADFLRGRPAFTEADARLQLAHRGFVADEIDEKIVKARRFREWAPGSLAERTTRIGYRSARGQTVARKTDRFGTAPLQRIYAMHCEWCGHEYGANGCDTHTCRCPACQNGSPAVPV